MSRQSDSDNHANQLNPNNDAYWESRGYDERPEDWEGGDGHMYSQSELDNRANQLNPEHDAYWQSRGFEGRPNSTKDDGYGEEDTFSPSDVDGAGIDPSRENGGRGAGDGSTPLEGGDVDVTDMDFLPGDPTTVLIIALIGAGAGLLVLGLSNGKMQGMGRNLRRAIESSENVQELRQTAERAVESAGTRAWEFGQSAKQAVGSSERIWELRQTVERVVESAGARIQEVGRKVRRHLEI